MELNTRQVNAVERVNQGLRAFFGKVYNYMAGGLVLSAIMAYIASHEPVIQWLYTVNNHSVSLSALGWIVSLAPLILVFMLGSAVNHSNPQKAAVLFWTLSALIGLSLGNVFIVYTEASVAQTFLVTAGTFLALSIYGSSTKRDLSGFGSFLFMGLIGLILASIVNIFLKSSMTSFVISVIGVMIFAGLTAYDTNRLKLMYENASSEDQQKAFAISGALSLYLDFINLFFYLLHFFGNERK